MNTHILCYPRCITRYSGIFIVKKGVIAMSDENKIRILYVQPGKYPEERLFANEVRPLQQLVGGDIQDVYWNLSICA